jgi:hypothetical protein
MRAWLVPVVLWAALFVPSPVHAQVEGLDSVWVELYHTQVIGKDTLKTYRIFVDMQAGYTMQMVYGMERHQLEISTTTTFYNHPEESVRYAEKLPADKLNAGIVALDSWLTIGAASQGHLAVPKHLDPDGSILKCPPYDKAKVRARRLCKQDGLLAVDSVPQVINLRMDPGYLGTIPGQVIHTMDGAWAVPGGTRGVTEENMVLIAQLSTTGVLSYQLNLQLGAPDGSFIRLVHSAAAPAEVLMPSLRRTLTF